MLKSIYALLTLAILVSACSHNENDPPNEAVDTTPDTSNPEVRASIAAASGTTVVNDRFACTFGDRIGPDFKIIITDIGGDTGNVAGVYQVSGGGEGLNGHGVVRTDDDYGYHFQDGPQLMRGARILPASHGGLYALVMQREVIECKKLVSKHGD